MGRTDWMAASSCCFFCFLTLPTLCLGGFPRQFSPGSAFPSDAPFVHTEGGLLCAQQFSLTPLSQSAARRWTAALAGQKLGPRRAHSRTKSSASAAHSRTKSLGAWWCRYGLQQEGGVVAYRGIPYAAPPVNESRWMPPSPHSPWGHRPWDNDSVLNATRFSSTQCVSCLQRLVHFCVEIVYCSRCYSSTDDFAGVGMGSHARSLGRPGQRLVGGRTTRQAEASAPPRRTACFSMCTRPSRPRPRARVSFDAVARPLHPQLRVAQPRARCALGTRSQSCARRIAARLRSILSVKALPHLHLRL
eukprot:COSAG02_NODE_312_length_24941_cov_60.672611_15_plen_303_part_00